MPIPLADRHPRGQPVRDGSPPRNRSRMAAALDPRGSPAGSPEGSQDHLPDMRVGHDAGHHGSLAPGGRQGRTELLGERCQSGLIRRPQQEPRLRDKTPAFLYVAIEGQLLQHHGRPRVSFGCVHGRDDTPPTQVVPPIIEETRPGHECRVTSHPCRLRPDGIHRLEVGVQGGIDIIPGSCGGAGGLATPTGHSAGSVELSSAGQPITTTRPGSSLRTVASAASAPTTPPAICAVPAGVHGGDATGRWHRWDSVEEDHDAHRRPADHRRASPGTRWPCRQGQPTDIEAQVRQRSSAHAPSRRAPRAPTPGCALMKRTVCSMSGRRAATAASRAWSSAVAVIRRRRSGVRPPARPPRADTGPP